MTSLKPFAPLILILVLMNHPAVAMSIVRAQYRAVHERVTFEWPINNFTLLPRDKGQYIDSPTIYTNSDGMKWNLRLYSQGNKSDDYLSLYFICDYRYHVYNNWAQFELSIIKTNGVKFKLPYNDTYGRTDSWGAKEFIKRSDLLNISGSDDTFVIRAVIDLPRDGVTETLKHLLEQDHESEEGRWNENFSGLFNNPKFSDVVVVVSGEKFFAHKVVLASRSPIFAAKFEVEESTGNRSNEVKIGDMEPVVVKAMLEFIYKNEVVDLKTAAAELLAAAEKFGLTRLKTMCEIVLCRTLNFDNAADFLVLTDSYNSYKLKDYVMEFIGDNFPTVMETEGYKKLEKTHTNLLKELSRVVVYKNSKM